MLSSALERDFRARENPRNKRVVLFLLVFSPIFFWHNLFPARAFSEKNSGVITVKANVPLTSEFIYSIQNNSILKLDKAAFPLGEEVRVKIFVAAANHFTLRGHILNLQVTSARGEILATLMAETGENGEANFHFRADTRLQGLNTLKILDVTYGRPITLAQQTLIIYQPADNAQELEYVANTQSGTDVISGDPRLLLNETETSETDFSAFPNNGKINQTNRPIWSNDP